MKNYINDLPIAKTFMVNNNYYTYDTYKNHLLHISKDHFKEINELLNIGLSEYVSKRKQTQEYKDIILLIHKGYFKSDFVKFITHPDTEYISDLTSRCINDLTLQVTRDCNFKCRYCLFTRNNKIDRSHEKITMPWNIAQKSVDYLFDNSKDVDEVAISFYGGEPLLNHSLIKDIVMYANKKFQTKTITYHMTTNGSIMSQEISDLLIENRFHILISLDGPQEIQDKHRKFYETGRGTFDIVTQNIKMLKEKNNDYFDHYVRFNPVILPDEEINNITNFYQSQDIDDNRVNYTYANMSGIDYIKSYTAANTDKEEKIFSNADTVLANALKNKDLIPPTWHHNGPCIPSINRLFVDVYGNFYPCEKVIEVPFSTIGNLNSGIDKEKVKTFLNIGKLTEDLCKHCWAMRFCEICISKCIDPDKIKFMCGNKTECRKIFKKAMCYY